MPLYRQILWNLATVKNDFSLSKIRDGISLPLLNSGPGDQSGHNMTKYDNMTSNLITQYQHKYDKI